MSKGIAMFVLGFILYYSFMNSLPKIITDNIFVDLIIALLIFFSIITLFYNEDK